MKKSTLPLKSTLPSGDFASEEAQLYNDATQEPYLDVSLNKDATTTAQIYEDGCVVMAQGGFCISLSAQEAVCYAAAIFRTFGLSRDKCSPYERIAKIIGSEEARREFLESVVGDEEY